MPKFYGNVYHNCVWLKIFVLENFHNFCNYVHSHYTNIIYKTFSSYRLIIPVILSRRKVSLALNAWLCLATVSILHNLHAYMDIRRSWLCKSTGCNLSSVPVHNYVLTHVTACILQNLLCILILATINANTLF